jgi:hypothetical protein
MRVNLIALIVVVGCVAVGGAAPRSVDDRPPSDPILSEATVSRPLVPLGQLLDEVPDGANVIELYKAARTVRDVEAANLQLKAQVAKAQAVASDVGRLHAAAVRLCEDTETSQVDTIAFKARDFSATLARVESELTKSLATMQQKHGVERPASIRAKEDINRLSLATHELGRLRVQVQEIARTIEGFGVGLRKLAASCTPMLVPPMFAERDGPPKIVAPAKGPSVLNRPAAKPTAPLVRHFAR